MTRAERKEQILDAAMSAFAERGMSGTSTDRIAREAGVSQPYVIRLFGTKELLFLAVLGRAWDRLTAIVRAATPAADLDALISACRTALRSDRELSQVLLHGFAEGAEPAVARIMRDRFDALNRIVLIVTRESAAECRRSLSDGLLAVVVTVWFPAPDEFSTPVTDASTP